MVEKDARQAALRRLVESGTARKQNDLLDGLRGQGIRINQSTLSRDLAELGVRKEGGRYVLHQPGGDGQEPLDFATAVRRFTTCGPHLIVIATTVGLAQAVAVEIEAAQEPAVTGTLAGDDTVFLATKNRRSQTVAIRRLKQMFGEKQA